MLEELKQQVCDWNLKLVWRGVVIYTCGNISDIDREKGFMVIKPFGVNLALNSNVSIKQYVLDKHYMRKYGSNTYYSQK